MATRARWVLAGLLAPLAILPHEAGHALVALARGCDHVALHSAWVSAQCGGAPGEAVQLVAGPLVSWLLAVVGVLAMRRWHCPEGFIVAVCCAGRALIGLEALAVSPSGTDEEKLSAVTGIPDAALVLPQVIATLVVFAWAWRLARRHGVERDAAIGMLAAMVSGMLYLSVVGPALLP